MQLMKKSRNAVPAEGTAWDQVDYSDIAFAHQARQATDHDQDNNHNAIPQLHFSCTLEDVQQQFGIAGVYFQDGTT